MEINETFFYLDGGKVIRGELQRIETGTGYTVYHLKDVLSGEISVKFRNELFESVSDLLNRLQWEFTGRMKNWKVSLTA